ncbi:Hypothetical protein, putative, partial [Bodo saltans]
MRISSMKTSLPMFALHFFFFVVHPQGRGVVRVGEWSTFVQPFDRAITMSQSCFFSHTRPLFFFLRFSLVKTLLTSKSHYLLCVCAMTTVPRRAH